MGRPGLIKSDNELLERLKQEDRERRGYNLPYLQRRFVALYDGTNLDQLEKTLKTRRATMLNWLKSQKIIDAIAIRDEIEDGPIIASRTERKELWTNIMYDDSVEVKDRLKASELLGKSECDFSETRILKGVGTGTTVIINTGVPRAPGDGNAEVEIRNDEAEEAVIITSVTDLFS